MRGRKEEVAKALAADAERLAKYPERSVDNWAVEAASIERWTTQAAQELDISVYTVTYDDGDPDGSPAYWDERSKEIRIHRASWAASWSDRERLETIAHEMFHAHQWRTWFVFERQRQSLAFDNPIAQQARRWRPYTSPRAPTRRIKGPDDRAGIEALLNYWGHPFESDARDFGREFADRVESAGGAW